MTEKTIIRRATEADLGQMYDVSVSAHASGYDKLLDPREYERYKQRHAVTDENREEYVLAMSRHLSKSEWTMYVAQADDAVLGYVSGRTQPDGTFLFRGLFVSSAAQGRGIGALLFKKLVDQYGHSDMSLKVIEANRRAVALYEKYGFRAIGETVGFYYGAAEIMMYRKAT